MSCNKTYLPDNFFMVGVNYNNTDAATRGQFAISKAQYQNILEMAPSSGVNELFVLSTCNRTEIYGFAKSASRLIELLCSQTAGDIELFASMAYTKNALDAVTHLYNVGSGLDSQILGDYEIVSQLKEAVNFSREHKFIGSFLDRLINSVLQASKKIKTTTSLSTGSVSVSFSAVKYIKEKTNFKANGKILVLGAGKIGRNTCKNLVDYFESKNITVINRSEEKAIQLAHELNLQYASMYDLASQIDASEIIIVATNAVEPVIFKSDLLNKGNKVIIDLSIPCNVDDGVNELPNITLIHVDQISKLKDENLKKREAEVPKAKKIIAFYIEEFMQWHEMRKHVPVLKAIKTKLKELHSAPSFYTANKQPAFVTINIEDKVQNVINRMAAKMLMSQKRGCHYIEAINEFIMAEAN